MVDLGCVQIDTQYLGSCDVFPKLHGGPKNVEILHIFGHGCSTRVPSLVNFGLQTPENEAS